MKHPVNVDHHEDNPLSVRIAETVIGFFGSITYIVLQTIFVLIWVTLNVIGIVHHWDPYPFILLNLAFSTQAAYAAPLILLGQNRQGEKDRKMAEFDYKHNSESLALLRGIHRDMHGEECGCTLEVDPQ